MAACKEAYNQLKEQLTEERGQGEELERHLQDERQVSAELQEQLDVARSEAHKEQEQSQAQLRQASLQPIQGLLHLVRSLLDAVVMTCLTQTWLLRAFALSHACVAFAVSHACMTCMYQARL